METRTGKDLTLAEKSLAFMQAVTDSSDLNALVRVTSGLLGNPVSLVDAEEQLLACYPAEINGQSIDSVERLTEAASGYDQAEEALIVEEYGHIGRLSLYAADQSISDEDRQFLFLTARAVAIFIRPQIGIKVMTQLSKLQLMRKLLA